MLRVDQLHPLDGEEKEYFAVVRYIGGKYEIARRYKPRKIVEIGVNTGYAAWAFIQAAEDPATVSYIGFDDWSYGPFPEWAMQTLLRGCGRASVVRTDTQTVDSLGVTGDFIHVDGCHTMVGVMHDLDLALQAMEPEGVILVDDYDDVPDVRMGVDAWLAAHPKLKWKYCETLRGDILIGTIKGPTQNHTRAIF